MKRRWLLNPVFIRHLRDYLFASAQPPSRHTALPSAGLIGVVLALRSCRRVTFYGFGNASEANETAAREACEHYYECAIAGGKHASQARYFSAGHPSNPSHRNHDWVAQWRLMARWIDDHGRAALSNTEARAEGSERRRSNDGDILRPPQVRIVSERQRHLGSGDRAGAAWSIDEQSQEIEERWRRQFGTPRHLARSRQGAHFPPSISHGVEC